DPGPERDARDPAGSRLGIDRLRPVQGRRCVRELPLAVVKIALREADSAKVKAKDRESTLGKSVVKIVDNLIVHRPAELRMRVKNDGDGRAADCRGVKPAFDASGGPIKLDLGHSYSKIIDCADTC